MKKIEPTEVGAVGSKGISEYNNVDVQPSSLRQACLLRDFFFLQAGSCKGGSTVVVVVVICHRLYEYRPHGRRKLA